MQEIQRSDSGIRLQLQKVQGTVEYLTDTLETFLVEEISAISHLKWLRQQVGEFERKCEELKGRIEAARSSKQKMEKVVEDIRRSLSPMRTLPTELLIKVFEIIINDHDQSRRYILSDGGRPSSSVIPLILVQVCKRWRAIVHETTSLWNSLHFQARAGGNALTMQQKIAQFRHCAGFGSPSQQSIFIPNCDREQFIFFCETLGTRTSRFRKIEIEMVRDPVTTVGRPASDVNFEEITVYRNGNVSTVEPVVPLLRLAQTLTIHGTPPNWGSDIWSSLRTLILKEFCSSLMWDCRISDFTHLDLVRLLNAAPYLNTLELYFEFDNEVTAPEHPVTINSNLKILSVHLQHFVPGKGLFGVQLTLRCLDTHEFASLQCFSDPLEDAELMFKYITPKKVVLPSLDEDDVPSAVKLLHSLPSVACVEMRGGRCDDLLNSLHAAYLHSVPPSASLPILQATTLHISRSDIQGETLLKFVEIKLQHRIAGTLGVMAIQHIMMYTTPGVTVADWGRLQAMLEAGRKANDFAVYLSNSDGIRVLSMFLKPDL